MSFSSCPVSRFSGFGVSTTVLFVSAMFALGCAGSDAESRRAEGDVFGDAPERSSRLRPRLPEPLLMIRGWPLDDGSSQYRLIWDGGDTRLPLFEEPDANSELIAELAYKQGQEIETDGDYVAVHTPAVFKARRKLTIEGTVHATGYQTGEQPFAKKLKKGASLAIFGYAGDGRCYAGLGGRIIVTTCPDPENFTGNFEGPTQAFQMQPVERTWWVRISTPVASGWVPLDDRVIADVFPLKSKTAVAQSTPEDPAAPEDQSVPEEPAVPEAVASREDAMFGEESGTEVATGPEEAADTQAEGESTTSGGLGAPVLSDEDIEERLASKNDALDVGAFAFLQLQYFATEGDDLGQSPISAPSLFDVYLDAQPNQRVRAYARGRLVADFAREAGAVDTLGEEIPRLEAALDQLWIKFDIARSIFATIGKQRIKWGTGRLWNPTDFLNAEPINPLSLAVFDPRLGVTLAKLHMPVESLGWNFYAIAVLDEAVAPDRIGAAFRAEFLHGLTEVSLSGLVRKDAPYRFGADLSTGFWMLDFHVEAAALYKDPRPYYTGVLDLPLVFPEEVSREDELIPQVVAGVEMQIPYRRGDLLVLGVEAFYNAAGYEDANLYPWLFFNDRYVPFFAGREYGGAYAALMGPGSWDETNVITTVLANFSDSSYVARLDLTQSVLTHLRWNAFGNFHFGDAGEFNYGVEIVPNIFAPEGVTIPQPLFEAGIGLQLDL